MGYNHNIAMAYTGYVAVKFVCLLLESTEKRGVLKSEYKSYPPEALSSVFNRSTFWWLNRLFSAGFGRLLFMEDLFPLDKHLKSEYLEKQLEAAWAKGKQ
jgi:ATP-binding cassette subfamily C (CFTR/MRP) protein 1